MGTSISTGTSDDALHGFLFRERGISTSSSISISTDDMNIEPVSPNQLEVSAFPVKPMRDYRVNKKIGEGGFSIVYKATALHPSSSRRHVAIKEVNILKLNDKQAARLRTELNILSQLNHPSIVRLHSVYYQTDRVYMVMDYLRGGELLSAICRREYYTEGDARHLMKQICSALIYMHLRRIIHHDLKPENLILESSSLESSVKIIDFGLATFEDDARPSRHVSGTPGYLAPELVSFQAYNTQIDVWSLGVILFILLSGTMPYETDDPRKVLTTQHSFPEHRWHRVSTKAKNLINRMLTKDPVRRITAFEIADDPWMRLPSRLQKQTSFSKRILSATKSKILLRSNSASKTVPQPSSFEPDSKRASEDGSSESDTDQQDLFSTNSQGSNDISSPGGDNDLSYNLPALREYNISSKFEPLTLSAVIRKEFKRADSDQSGASINLDEANATGAVEVKHYRGVKVFRRTDFDDGPGSDHDNAHSDGATANSLHLKLDGGVVPPANYINSKTEFGSTAQPSTRSSISSPSYNTPFSPSGFDELDLVLDSSLLDKPRSFSQPLLVHSSSMHASKLNPIAESEESGKTKFSVTPDERLSGKYRKSRSSSLDNGDLSERFSELSMCSSSWKFTAPIRLSGARLSTSADDEQYDLHFNNDSDRSRVTIRDSEYHTAQEPSHMPASFSPDYNQQSHSPLLAGSSSGGRFSQPRCRPLYSGTDNNSKIVGSQQPAQSTSKRSGRTVFKSLDGFVSHDALGVAGSKESPTNSKGTIVRDFDNASKHSASSDSFVQRDSAHRHGSNRNSGSIRLDFANDEVRRASQEFEAAQNRTTTDSPGNPYSYLTQNHGHERSFAQKHHARDSMKIEDVDDS